MPNFLETIFAQLQRSAGRVVLREFTGAVRQRHRRELLEHVCQVRAYLRTAGVRPGDRCALSRPTRFTGRFDLALMAKDSSWSAVRPQSPAELAAMMKDSVPKLLLVSDAGSDAAMRAWTGDSSSRPAAYCSTKFCSRPRPLKRFPTLPIRARCRHRHHHYTSVLREPKGVCLTRQPHPHASCTTERLDQLMGQTASPTASSIGLRSISRPPGFLALLLSRESVLTLSTDLTKLADEIRLSSSHYFLNVPTLLERVRRGVEDALSKRAAPIRSLYAKARAAWQRQNSSRARTADALWLALGRKLIFSKIKERFGPHLRALICARLRSLPKRTNFSYAWHPGLAGLRTHRTTAICTLDDRRQIEPGYVAKRSAHRDESRWQRKIVVRARIFLWLLESPGRKPHASSATVVHTGDQGE